MSVVYGLECYKGESSNLTRKVPIRSGLSPCSTPRWSGGVAVWMCAFYASSRQRRRVSEEAKLVGGGGTQGARCWPRDGGRGDVMAEKREKRGGWGGGLTLQL